MKVMMKLCGVGIFVYGSIYSAQKNIVPTNPQDREALLKKIEEANEQQREELAKVIMTGYIQSRQAVPSYILQTLDPETRATAEKHNQELYKIAELK